MTYLNFLFLVPVLRHNIHVLAFEEELSEQDKLSIKQNIDQVLLTEQPFAAGSFGKIYLINQDWVIKQFFFNDPAIKEKMIEKIGSEAKILSKLKHRNVDKLIAFFPSIPCFLLNYYPHGSLEKFLRNTEITDEMLKSIALDIAQGMNYIHSCNTIHRDLKPSNCLVTKKRESKYISF